MDVNVPGIIILKGKEERQAARALGDTAAKEKYRRETRSFAKHRGELACEKELGELLVANRVITAEQLASAKEAQKGSGLSIITVLVSLHMSDEVKIALVISHETGLLFSNAEVLQVDKGVRELFPPEAMATYEAIPLSRSGASLVVAMVNPLDKEAIREIEGLTKLKVNPVVCTKTAFKTALTHRYKE